jgi:hypothetical protein
MSMEALTTTARGQLTAHVSELVASALLALEHRSQTLLSDAAVGIHQPCNDPVHVDVGRNFGTDDLRATVRALQDQVQALTTGRAALAQNVIELETDKQHVSTAAAAASAVAATADIDAVNAAVVVSNGSSTGSNNPRPDTCGVDALTDPTVEGVDTKLSPKRSKYVQQLYRFECIRLLAIMYFSREHMLQRFLLNSPVFVVPCIIRLRGKMRTRPRRTIC